MKHESNFYSIPMADAWIASCSCGWKEHVSYWDYKTQEEMRTALRNAFDQHLKVTTE